MIATKRKKRPAKAAAPLYIKPADMEDLVARLVAECAEGTERPTPLCVTMMPPPLDGYTPDAWRALVAGPVAASLAAFAAKPEDTSEFTNVLYDGENLANHRSRRAMDEDAAQILCGRSVQALALALYVARYSEHAATVRSSWEAIRERFKHDPHEARSYQLAVWDVLDSLSVHGKPEDESTFNFPPLQRALDALLGAAADDVDTTAALAATIYDQLVTADLVPFFKGQLLLALEQLADHSKTLAENEDDKMDIVSQAVPQAVPKVLEPKAEAKADATKPPQPSRRAPDPPPQPTPAQPARHATPEPPRPQLPPMRPQLPPAPEPRAHSIPKELAEILGTPPSWAAVGPNHASKDELKNLLRH